MSARNRGKKKRDVRLTPLVHNGSGGRRRNQYERQTVMIHHASTHIGCNRCRWTGLPADFDSHSCSAFGRLAKP